jgi:hypothetical protein
MYYQLNIARYARPACPQACHGGVLGYDKPRKQTSRASRLLDLSDVICPRAERSKAIDSCGEIVSHGAIAHLTSCYTSMHFGALPSLLIETLLDTRHGTARSGKLLPCLSSYFTQPSRTRSLEKRCMMLGTGTQYTSWITRPSNTFGGKFRIGF